MTQSDGAQGPEGQPGNQAQQNPADIEQLRADLVKSQEATRVLQGQYDQVLAANQQWDAWARNVDSRVNALETTPPAPAGEPAAANPYGYGDTPDPVADQLKQINDRNAREDAEKQQATALAAAQQSGQQHIADAMRKGGLVDDSGQPDYSLIDWAFMAQHPGTVDGANQATLAGLKIIAAKSGEIRQKRTNSQSAEQKQAEEDAAERQRQLGAAVAQDNGAVAAQVSASPGTPSQADTDLYKELVDQGRYAEAAPLRKKIEKDLRHGVTVPHPTSIVG